MSRDSACSHIRAFQLFAETISNKLKSLTTPEKFCQFTAYSCPGGMPSYERGHCFPLLEKITNKSLTVDSMKADDIGQFGEDVKGEGIMYFSTRDSSPFCG